jgi:hypothetical protein
MGTSLQAEMKFEVQQVRFTDEPEALAYAHARANDSGVGVDVWAKGAKGAPWKRYTTIEPQRNV